MIDFAKSKGVKNKQALIGISTDCYYALFISHLNPIDNAIAYRKHPRNAINLGGVTPSTPFCQKAPKNSELKGVTNAQLDGVNPGVFGSPKFPVVPFGDRAYIYLL